jgi:hypothetical protein
METIDIGSWLDQFLNSIGKTDQWLTTAGAFGITTFFSLAVINILRVLKLHGKKRIASWSLSLAILPQVSYFSFSTGSKLTLIQKPILAVCALGLGLCFHMLIFERFHRRKNGESNTEYITKSRDK